MPGKISLFVPGPTNMPDRVRQAMDISNEDHRAPGMDKFWHPLIDDLKKVFEKLLKKALQLQVRRKNVESIWRDTIIAFQGGQYMDL